jgi:hypothetical protein
MELKGFRFSGNLLAALAARLFPAPARPFKFDGWLEMKAVNVQNTFPKGG